MEFKFDFEKWFKSTVLITFTLILMLIAIIMPLVSAEFSFDDWIHIAPYILIPAGIISLFAHPYIKMNFEQILKFLLMIVIFVIVVLVAFWFYVIHYTRFGNS